MKFCPQCKTGFPDQAETCPTDGGYLSEIVDLKPGMHIRSTYRIVRKLGEGGMGAVYLAEHTLMEEPRALKFLSRQLSRDEDFTTRFRREVRTLRQVRHKNVVDSGDLERAEDDTLFFAMEFVDGPDLRAFLRHAPRPFDVVQALHVARGIAEGLGAAHAKGMVHRDIKPENILMAREGEARVPKIADFGIVSTKENSSMYTRTGGTLLTMAYAAPEQWRGTAAAQLDGRTDLYALGGVLFEMLTGQTVFNAESYEGWAEQHRNVSPRLPSTLRPDLADWLGLDALVSRLLAKNREERPRDVAEVLSLIGGIKYQASGQRHLTVLEEPLPNATQLEVPQARPRDAAGLQGLFSGRDETVFEPSLKESHQLRPRLSAEFQGLFGSAEHADGDATVEKARPAKSLRRFLFLIPLGFAVFLIGAMVIGSVHSSQSPTSREFSLSSPPAQNPAPTNTEPPPPPPPPPWGSIAGKAEDPTGAVVPGIKITVSSRSKDFVHDVTTDSQGRYRVDYVPSGDVAVSAEGDGFSKLTFTRVALRGGQLKRFNLPMHVGSSAEEIEVNVKQ